MIKVLQNIKEKVYNLLFPNHIKCIFCGEELKTLNWLDACDTCMETLPMNNQKTCIKCGGKVFAASNYCQLCKNSVRFFDKARTPMQYKEPINVLIRQFKYKGKRYLASTFAKYIFNEYLVSNYDVDVVYFVPMHANTKQQRIYNHAELLASEFCKLSHIPIETKNFLRIIETRQQAKLNKREREINLENAFRVVDNKKLKNKNILLIDDVITTGSTINECAKTLKECGANSVFVLAIAHTPNFFYTIKQNISVKSAKSIDKLSKIMYNTQARANKNSVMGEFIKQK